MESEPTYHVPEELMQRLHAANENFHHSRAGWERMLGNTEYRHQERIDQAGEKLRAAERELEEANEAIRKALRENAPPRLPPGLPPGTPPQGLPRGPRN